MVYIYNYIIYICIYTLISLKEKWNMDTNIAPFTVPFTTLQSDQKKILCWLYIPLSVQNTPNYRRIIAK